MQSLIKAEAIYLVQGPGVLLKKTFDFMLQHLGVLLSNDIIPIVEKEGMRVRYNTYIDVGACDGDTLVPVAHLFNKCVAVEPDPRNIIELKEATKNLKNCIIVDCRLAESEGHTSLQVSERGDQSSLYVKGNNSVQVRVDTIDNLVQKFDLKPPYFIKIDTQGAEYHVLKGGQRTLKAKATVLCEFWPHGLLHSGQDPYELIQMMASNGFAILNLRSKKVDDERLIKFIQLGCDNPAVSTDLIFRNFE